jgi:hypothetical protein
MWWCVAACVVTALRKRVVPPSSGWSLWAQRLHHADLKQSPASNCKAKGWEIWSKRVGGGPWEWHIALQSRPTAHASDRKKNWNQNEFQLNIPPTVNTIVSKAAGPFPASLNPSLIQTFFFLGFPLSTIPHTLTSNTRDMDCEVRNVSFKKVTTNLCDMIKCGVVEV